MNHCVDVDKKVFARCHRCGREPAANIMCGRCFGEDDDLRARLAVAIWLIRDLRDCCQDLDWKYGKEWGDAQRIVEGKE